MMAWQRQQCDAKHHIDAYLGRSVPARRGKNVPVTSGNVPARRERSGRGRKRSVIWIVPGILGTFPPGGNVQDGSSWERSRLSATRKPIGGFLR